MLVVGASVSWAAACSPGPVTWDEGVTAAPDTPLSANGVRPPSAPFQCTGTVRTAVSARGVHYAVWWSVRPDSSADIVASASRDGRSWTSPAKLDTADTGKSGCRRPAPALVADGDNLQVVYAMQAREGPGVFLSHSMDGARTFHSPVAVVYGEKPGLASVAAKGNFVVVAYEDPNTTPTRISVAVSTTMAHLFEYRAVVSPEDAAATRPEVWTDGDQVVLSWVRSGDSTTRITLRGHVR